VRGPHMAPARAQRKAQMAAAAARRTGPGAPPAGRTAIRSKPVRVTLDLSPELYRQLTQWADSAAVALGVPRVPLADAMRAMIRVTTENPGEVLARLRRDREPEAYPAAGPPGTRRSPGARRRIRQPALLRVPAAPVRQAVAMRLRPWLCVAAAHPDGGEAQQGGGVCAEQAESGPGWQRGGRVRRGGGDGLPGGGGQEFADVGGPGSGQEAGRDRDGEQEGEQRRDPAGGAAQQG